MFYHVSLELSSLCESVFTLLAAEHLFSSMNKHVLFKMSIKRKQVCTNLADMELLPFSDAQQTQDIESLP